MEKLFLIVPAFIALCFLAIFATIIVQAASGIAEWSRNNALPVEESAARVVAKRTETSGGGHTHAHAHRRVRTSYYATFELASGERVEFGMPGPEFGLLAEGDDGTLSRQGTRYLGFHRTAGKASGQRDF